MASEFSIIDAYFKPLSFPQSNDSSCKSKQIGIGDDGAVITPPANQQLVVVTDTSIENVHFPAQTSAYFIGWKSLAVNLSDLAAMGATPAFYSLALSLPKHLNNKEWLTEFARGLATLANIYNIPLVGGDTTKSDILSITITANGWVKPGESILRSNAKVGDDIFVSGNLGTAGLGLKSVLNTLPKGFVLKNEASCILELNQPKPRVELGLALQGVANSMIDLSDGLLADIQHILTSSKVSAEINYNQIPLNADLKHYLSSTKDKLFPIICGDDYELCFTLPASKRKLLVSVEEFCQIKLTCIGRIVAGEKAEMKLTGLDNADSKLSLESLGFKHF